MICVGLGANDFSKTLGIGFLNIAVYELKLPIYKKPDSKTKIDEVKIRRSSDGSWLFESNLVLKPAVIFAGSTDKEGRKNEASGLIAFHPKFRFRVLSVEGDYFKVVIDEEKWKSAYIKKSKEVLYITWAGFLKSVYCIEMKPLRIYDKIDGKMLVFLNSRRFYPFLVSKVQGDWAKIKQHPSYMYDKVIPKKGWVKWKEGEKLLVDVVEEVYE